MEIKAIPDLKWLNWFASSPHTWNQFQKESIWKSSAQYMKFQKAVSNCKRRRRSKNRIKNTLATLTSTESTTPARAPWLWQIRNTHTQLSEHNYSHWSQYFKLYIDLSTILKLGQIIKLPEFAPSITISKNIPLCLEPSFLINIYLMMVSCHQVYFYLSCQRAVQLF